MSEKYFFILGSRFKEEHEYKIPKMLDPLCSWKVFSIDYYYQLDEKNNNYSKQGVDVYRIQMNIADIFDRGNELVEIYYSTVYIMDTISCGFITNTSKKMVQHFIKNHNRVYFLHYISPKNIDHSISLKNYGENILHDMFDTCFMDKLRKDRKDSIINTIIKIIYNYPEDYMNLSYLRENLIPRIFDNQEFYNCAAKFLGNIDIDTKLKFTEIKRDDIVDWDKLLFPKSCTEKNNIDSQIYVNDILLNDIYLEEPIRRKSKTKRSRSRKNTKMNL